MPVDQVLSFAALNHLLRRLPPGLAVDVEAAITAVGFDSFLVAVCQAKDGSRFFAKMVEEAVKEVKHRRALLNVTRAELLSKVTYGARVKIP